MKRIAAFFSLILLIACFCGCTKEEPAPDATVPQQPSAPTDPAPSTTPTMPVEDDVFYFANELEYDRLYSMREDGTNLKLVLDTFCYDVQQHGDTVYFSGNGTLHTYHIPTGTHTVLLNGVWGYKIDGSYLVYGMNSDRFYYTHLRCRNVETGEDFQVATAIVNGFAVRGSDLYYVETDFDSYTACIRRFRLDTREDTVLADGFNSCFEPYAVDGGVVFRGYSEDNDEYWYFASSDGQTLVPLHFVPEGSDVCDITRDSALYVSSDYSGKEESIFFSVNDQGQTEVLFRSEPGAYVIPAYLGNDRWLIRQQVDEPIGEINEYGGYDDYAHHYSYYLMRSDRSVIPVDTRGELAAMFAAGDFPLLDSSTARKPITRELYNVFVRNFEYEGAEPLCSTTHDAWLNIADRKADLALLAAPTKEEQAYLKEQGVEVEMKLYGGDGLVFIGNNQNPVTNLTKAQLISIYQGKITNWREVGGPDEPIIVYYRDDQSGSQRLFENLVFKGLDVPDYEALGFYIQDDMSTIVNTILSDPYAIGYSIMTYLEDVYAEENLHVFSIDGVTPSPDTVKDSSYPFNTKGYLVIRSDEPANSPARRLFNWFGCPVSDEILRINGVSPLSDGVG